MPHPIRVCFAPFRSMILGAVAAAWLCGCSSSQPPAPIAVDDGAPTPPAALAGGRGTLLAGTQSVSSGDYPYLVYLPAGHHPDRQWPLYVMLHGCSTTAEQQMQANRLNPLADREGFIVLYPDVTPLHARSCWRAVLGSVPDRTRGAGGDADAIAGMTLTLIDSQAVDPQRVYLAGMSSGGFAAASTAAVWPELYAAVGVFAAGGTDMDASCAVLIDPLIPLRVRLRLAGEEPTFLPLLAVGGRADPLRLGSNPAPGGCARLAFREWQALAQALAAERGIDTVDASRHVVEHGRVDGGHRWMRERESDASGCTLGEFWDIESMGHFWPGGTDDPAYAAFTDPLAPSGAELSWAFFAPLVKPHADGMRRCR